MPSAKGALLGFSALALPGLHDMYGRMRRGCSERVMNSPTQPCIPRLHCRRPAATPLPQCCRCPPTNSAAVLCYLALPLMKLHMRVPL